MQCHVFRPSPFLCLFFCLFILLALSSSYIFFGWFVCYRNTAGSKKKKRVRRGHNHSTRPKNNPAVKRRGKWLKEEEMFANKVIADFRDGIMPLKEGTTLRVYLSTRLMCDPMRISKKYAGKYQVGKQMYKARQPDAEGTVMRAAIEGQKVREALELAFWQRLRRDGFTDFPEGLGTAACHEQERLLNSKGIPSTSTLPKFSQLNANDNNNDNAQQRGTPSVNQQQDSNMAMAAGEVTGTRSRNSSGNGSFVHQVIRAPSLSGGSIGNPYGMGLDVNGKGYVPDTANMPDLSRWPVQNGGVFKVHCEDGGANATERPPTHVYSHYMAAQPNVQVCCSCPFCCPCSFPPLR